MFCALTSGIPSPVLRAGRAGHPGVMIERHRRGTPPFGRPLRAGSALRERGENGRWGSGKTPSMDKI